MSKWVYDYVVDAYVNEYGAFNRAGQSNHTTNESLHFYQSCVAASHFFRLYQVEQFDCLKRDIVWFNFAQERRKIVQTNYAPVSRQGLAGPFADSLGEGLIGCA